MRVLFLLDNLDAGGAERNTLDLMRALIGLSVEPHLCIAGRRCDERLLAEATGLGARVHRLHGARLYDPRPLLRLTRLLSRERFDVVHLQDPYPAPMALLASLVFGIPVVTTRHVLADDHSNIRADVRSRLLLRVMRAASDRIILPAARLRTPFAEQSGISPGRMVVVHNGIVSRPLVEGARDLLRRQLGWRSEERIILIVALLRGGKGHEDLFAAMPQILQASPGARLKVVGDGRERARLEALASPLGEAVAFLGMRSDVPDLMSAADLLVLPSWSEAYPTVLLEAAMAGLPSVTTDVGGAAEIVVDGETGLVVPPRSPDSLAQAIIGIVEDEQRLRSLGLAARRVAIERFTIERQARATLDVYRDLMGERLAAALRGGRRSGLPA